MHSLIRFVPMAVIPFVCFACVVDERSHGGGPYGYDNPPPDSTASPAPSTSGSTSSSSAAPMLVDVDTNQTMTADPGNGVGVFVEYAAGGTWHVWWTCDTFTTQQNCHFTVNVTAATGSIANIDSSQLSGGQYTSSAPSSVQASTTTSTGLDGLTFTTDPGALITVEAAVDGVEDGSFLFFVQNGKVNGGFTGKLTDPLQLEGKTP